MMVSMRKPRPETGPTQRMNIYFPTKRMHSTKDKTRTTMLPRVIHPRLPPAGCQDVIVKINVLRLRSGYDNEPLALSSEYSCATLSNLWPSWYVQYAHLLVLAEAEIKDRNATWIFCNASVAFPCFSQRICRTFTAVAALRMPFPWIRDRVRSLSCPSISAHLSMLVCGRVISLLSTFSATRLFVGLLLLRRSSLLGHFKTEAGLS